MEEHVSTLSVVTSVIAHLAGLAINVTCVSSNHHENRFQQINQFELYPLKRFLVDDIPF